MALVFKADSKRITLVAVLASAGIAFGLVLFLSIPPNNLIRFAFLTFPVFAAAASLWSILRRRVIFSDDGITTYRLFSKDYIPTGELKGWKIKENDRQPSLHLLTKAGRKIDVYEMGLLGVKDLSKASKQIAAELRKSQKPSENPEN
jgi:hypothetical protein